MNDLQALIDKAINHKSEPIELDCDIELKEDGQTFKAYSVSISNRDLLFYTDKGALNYLVDIGLGQKPTMSLWSIDLD